MPREIKDAEDMVGSQGGALAQSPAATHMVYEEVDGSSIYANLLEAIERCPELGWTASKAPKRIVAII
jgi:hypothetical protein